MKRFFTALIILSMLGCQQEPDGYAISGRVDSIENGKMIYVSQLDENNQATIIDSTVIQDKEFFLDLPEVDRSNLSFLTIDGVNGNVMYISENHPIEFEVYKDSLPASKVTGGKENEVFYEYLHYLKELNAEVMGLRMNMREAAADSSALAALQQQEDHIRTEDIAYKKNLIEDHPDAFVSLLVLTDMQSMGAPAGEVKQYFDTLSESVKQSPLAKALKANLDKMGSVEIGSKAPLFSGPNPDGEEIALADVMGKVTLIDFWAAWCKPCRVENPNIVRVYEKYHDKGFNIVGVSLDQENQRDRWLQAIEDDKLTWTQISHLQFWSEPIAQQYNIRAIPAAFILDENGVIVAKNLRGQDLENKVRELLEQ